MGRAYTEVGDEGIEDGDLEPSLCVRKSCEFLFESRLSRGGVARFVFEVIWRSSAADEGESEDMVT